MRRFSFNLIRYLIDVPIIIFSALIVRFLYPLTITDEYQGHIGIFTIAAVFSWYIAASFSRVYNDLRSKKFSEEIAYIIYSFVAFTVILSSSMFFLRTFFNYSNYFLLYFLSTSFTLVVLNKYILRKYLHRTFKNNESKDRLILVGSTPAARDFYYTINERPYYGYRCVGFLDDSNFELNGSNYLGQVAQLADVLNDIKVEEVIIALPNAKHEQIQYCIEICEQKAVRARIIPDFNFYTSSNIQINNIGRLPIINLRSLPLDKWFNRFVKRLLDIFAVLFFGILIAWWLMPIIALLIKIDSKGPVFFKQERWGLNNKLIICYKFRSMFVNSPQKKDDGSFNQASKNDTRITRIGRFLRASNIDELPQFWNVFIGNMSLVGPRPHVTPMNLAAIGSVDKYLQRHLVKPGITGWAQVNGSRGETSAPGALERRVNYDLYYIHRWTFLLDCQIILQTFINIIRGDENAY